MKTLKFAAFVLACLFGSAATFAQTTQSPHDEFVPLFNGTDLEGWHGRPHFSPIKLAAMTDEQRQEKLAQWQADALQHWTVEGDELVNDGHGAYLVTNNDYRDFELRLQYKTVAKADSGIYLKGNPQVQIWDHGDERVQHLGADKGSGGLWNNGKGAPGKDPSVLADRPFGQWNDVRVIQVGARTSVWLNGHHVVDHAIMENFWDRSSPLFPSGPIELQTHGGEIRWRNIKIRELTSDQANAILAQKGSDGFVELFNQTDLLGWIGATEHYEVVDGAIRCKAGSGGNLLMEKEYANFVARVEFRLPPGGNNGLAIRAPVKGDPAYKAMCELQVLDSTAKKYDGLDDRQYHGSAYGMVAAKRGFLRPLGEWNFQEVTVSGNRVKVELNGNIILDADLSEVTEYMDDKEHPGLEKERGHFGFAGHGDPVEFRNVWIKEI